MLCFGTFSEANNINFEPAGAIPTITGSGPFEIEKEIILDQYAYAERNFAVVAGPEVSVTISVSATGLGFGQATFSPVTVRGTTVPEYADAVIEVGTKTSKGKWRHGTKPIEGVFSQRLPAQASNAAASYPWSAEGKIVLTPYAWKESVTKGGGLRWPFQIQGTMTVTGTWEGQDNKKITRWAASGTQGSHDRKLIYHCSKCDEKGDSEEAIGGKEKHDWVTCPECGVQHRACDKSLAHKHSKDPDTGKYRCDPLQISLNKMDFMVGEELVVSVEREGHNYVNLYVDSKYRASGYPESSGSSSSETRTVLTSSDVGDRTVSVTVWVFDKNTKASTSTTETFTISVEAAPSVSLNNWSFTTYDTLEVTVSKSDLYYVDFTINGDSVPGQYASGNTSVTLQKSFDHDDAGYHQVAINIYWGENGERSTTHYEYVLILDDR
ncbi:hypothetical protein F4X73_01830 [Candidatus Poribacteria bacterium]|nr:hypothetical protein [Candidatus Poribacteria bacterium]